MPPLGRDPHPPFGAHVPAVLQQVGEGVGPQRVPLLGGLAQPVLGGGLVAPLTEWRPSACAAAAGPATAAIRHQPAASSA